ncbi:DUF1684 domain-containing protein [Leucobacter sp. HNU]|uniref:DUF1684 domain-containing protein n=1 Tax=Leucobacter sp. HNU TaxID=3236805 RepID=UPI003A804472
MMTEQPNPALSDEARAHAAWRESRREAVTSPTGNLSLVETRWFPAGTTAQEAGITAEAERSAARAAGRGDRVTVTELQRRDLATGEPEYGIRVWDADSAAIRAFDGTATFDYDPSWVIEAEFTPVAADRTIPFEHIRDAGLTRDLVVPGDITFERGGERFTLSAFDDDGQLLLVFGDPTNRATDGTQSYGAGRFLFVPRDAGAFGEPGRVTLDFNRAFVPPCGFSAQYNCPMPPAQNRLPWPILAGERLPEFRDGFDIYTV